MELTLVDASVRLLIALGLGAAVGIEREINQQSAGLRTHILVCMGSTLFTIVSISDLSMHSHTLQPVVEGAVQYTFNKDPSRIAAQIVTGIGFIGGGALLRHGATIRGLTTAASLWMMASIGMLVGVGMFKIATLATVLAFIVLFTIGHMEHAFLHKQLKGYNRLRMRLSVDIQSVVRMQDWLEKRFGREIVEVTSRTSKNQNSVDLSYIVTLTDPKLDINQLTRELNNHEGLFSSDLRVYYEPDR